MIPLDECVNRGVYQIASRNLRIGVFNEETHGFTGVREKFREKYLFEEYHHDTGAPFGTVHPNGIIGMLPDDIELKDRLPTSCQECGEDRLVEFRSDDPATRTPGKWYHSDDDSLMVNPHNPCSRQYQPLFDYLIKLEEATL